MRRKALNYLRSLQSVPGRLLGISETQAAHSGPRDAVVTAGFLSRLDEVIKVEGQLPATDAMEALELLLQFYRGYKCAYGVTATQSSERLERLAVLAQKHGEISGKISVAAPLKVPNRRLAVIHIPKTAGTSLRFQLMSQFPDAIWIDIGWDPMVRAGAVELENFDVIYGHMYLNNILSKDLETFKVAFFRHPVSFAQSIWRFLRSFADNPDLCKRPDIFAACKYDFETYITTSDPNAFNLKRNKQTALIIGEHFREEVWNPSLQEIILKRLEKVDFVGLTEHYEEHLQELLSILGAPPNGESAWLNRSGRLGEAQIEISADLRNEILRKSDLDVALYNAAVQRRQASMQP